MINPLLLKAQALVVVGSCTCLTAFTWIGTSNHAVRAAEQPSTTKQQLVQLPPSLVERLRKLLNITPPVAVGGSRGDHDRRVCLISPRVTATGNDQPTAMTTLPNPTLLAAGPLNEARIERNGQIVWRQRASSSQALEGPIQWPLRPLQPGERVVLWIRPQGSAGGDFAKVALIAADQGQQRTAALQTTPRGRLAAVQAAAAAGNDPLALELLFAPPEPASPAVSQLRLTLAAQACGLAVGPRR